MTHPVLELRAVTRVHETGEARVHALRSVSLSVAAGSLVAVMGPSGSDKTTLLSLAGGLDAPTEGEVIVEGVVLDTLSRKALAALRRRSLGYVFQDLPGGRRVPPGCCPDRPGSAAEQRGRPDRDASGASRRRRHKSSGPDRPGGAGSPGRPGPGRLRARHRGRAGIRRQVRHRAAVPRHRSADHHAGGRRHGDRTGQCGQSAGPGHPWPRSGPAPDCAGSCPCPVRGSSRCSARHGTVAGFVPSTGLVLVQRATDFPGVQRALAIPWPSLAITAVVVPALAIGIAGLFSRSRLPVERRPAA